MLLSVTGRSRTAFVTRNDPLPTTLLKHKPPSGAFLFLPRLKVGKHADRVSPPVPDPLREFRRRLMKIKVSGTHIWGLVIVLVLSIGSGSILARISSAAGSPTNPAPLNKSFLADTSKVRPLAEVLGVFDPSVSTDKETTTPAK